MTLLSKSAFAKEIGRSPPAITKMIKQGVIKKALVYKDGRVHPLIDKEKAIVLIWKNHDPNFRQAQPKDKGNGGRQGQSPTFVEARTSSEHYKAASRKLQYEIELRQWIKKDKAIDTVYQASRLCRDALMNIPARSASIVAAEIKKRLKSIGPKNATKLSKESNATKCRKIINDAISKATSDFINDRTVYQLLNEEIKATLDDLVGLLKGIK